MTEKKISPNPPNQTKIDDWDENGKWKTAKTEEFPIKLIRVDDIEKSFAKMRELISEIDYKYPKRKDLASFNSKLEKELEKLGLNVEKLKSDFGIEEMEREVEKNPSNVILESALKNLERSYANMLISIAKEKMEGNNSL
ncbi:MAG: hypothetical protein M1544_03200 [Candidatus Marsarchaeota archaeon]|nr:hypothetical protein [Candidatus Marsarchaeota archaeon]